MLCVSQWGLTQLYILHDTKGQEGLEGVDMMDTSL